MSRLVSARDTIERAKAAGCTKVLVGLSGGKDSLVTLDLCVAAFGHKNVACFFMYLVRGLRCVEDHVDAAAHRYGVEVFRVPHFSLANHYRHATLMPHRRDAHRWRETKFVDIENHAREKAGIEWTAYGHRMTDSLERRGMLHKARGCNDKQKRLYPLWEWVPKDVVSYLKAKHIRLPTQFGTKNVSGIDLRPETLRQMRDQFPEDFARLCAVFPYAPASILAGDIRKERSAEEEAATAERSVDPGRDAALVEVPEVEVRADPA